MFLGYLANSDSKPENPVLNRVQLDTDDTSFSQLSESCARTYTLPSISNGSLQINDAKIYNDNITAKKLNDIIDLIKINNQPVASSSNSTKSPLTKPILNFKMNPKDSIKIDDYPNQKLFITKLDQEEKALSNKMDRNMEFLQNCLEADMMSENSTQKLKTLSNSSLGSVNLTHSNTSNGSTSSNPPFAGSRHSARALRARRPKCGWCRVVVTAGQPQRKAYVGGEAEEAGGDGPVLQ